MSIGLGIFLSTVVAILAWQIDKRGAWRKAGKVGMWIGGIVALIFGLIVASIYWDSGRSARENRAQAAEVRSGLPSYWGLKLGMSDKEVLYIKGEPMRRLPKENGRLRPQWRYQNGSSYYDVLFTDDNRVDAISCGMDEGQGSTFDCEKVGGVELGTPEARVVELLGPPRKDNPVDRFGLRVFDYGSNKLNVRFILERQKVNSIFYSDWPLVDPADDSEIPSD